MSFLTKRTQILFSPNEHELLKKQYYIVTMKERMETAERLSQKKNLPVERWEEMEEEIMHR